MRDIYSDITNRIIEQVESGTLPWSRPWKLTGNGRPVNHVTGKPYRGINTLLLWPGEFPVQRWLTYKQAQAIGAQVRKGEHGSTVVFYKPWQVKDVNASGEQVERSIPLLRSFTVFNVAQCDGIELEPVPEVAITYDAAAALMTQAKVEHGSDRACYSPAHDKIMLPSMGQFKSEGDYWATALHELTHWTGHESRLNRLDKLARFGDDAYAREELIAELGASFLCADAGVPYTTQHASYVASWLLVLKSDKRAIIQAASAAQKAADWAQGVKHEETMPIAA